MRDGIRATIDLPEGAELFAVTPGAARIATGWERDGAPDRAAAARLRRIAVGIDGGRGAAAALQAAARLALAHAARLSLIAVAELGLGTPGRAHPDELRRLSRRLVAASEALAGIEVESELREGVPDRILVDLSRAADLLVLGSRAGYGDAGRVVLGDVSGRVLRDAPCPVLIVPAP